MLGQTEDGKGRKRLSLGKEGHKERFQKYILTSWEGDLCDLNYSYLGGVKRAGKRRQSRREKTEAGVSYYRSLALKSYKENETNWTS